MPWRLIGFILLFAIFLTFIGFNLENSCDVSFGFMRIEAVPVYLTAFSAFCFGMLCAVPFLFFLRRRKSKAKARPGELPAPELLETSKKGWWKRKKDLPQEPPKPPAGDGGSYAGID
jgi:uncharacterized integral membrane protein